MDGRFLSQAEVIAASRAFVCIRTATYESAKEAEFLKTVFVDRSGNLQNTVTAILSPDGSTILSRPGRSWDWAYREPAEMVTDMKRLAAKYPAKADVAALPAMADFRVSLNVAACDNLPLVVGVASTAEERTALDAKLRDAAWSADLIGRFAYAPSCEPAATVGAGLSLKPGVYVVQPGKFGVTGTVLASLDAAAPASEWTQPLLAALGKHKVFAKSSKAQVDAGRALGIAWKTAIPVTDTQEMRNGVPPPR